MDYYRDVYGTAIENPGTLYSNLLLMGDRQDHTGSKRTTRYSPVWGAGRFKMRRFDSTGLDNPMQWGSLQTCISHAEYYYYPSSSGQYIASDVDVMKVVAHWFDRRLEDGTQIDDINLALQEKVGSTWYTRVNDTENDDDKARVFWSDFSGGNYWRIRIHGNGVTSDATGCGTNSMRTHFAWFYEDSDRESWENLDEIDTEN